MESVAPIPLYYVIVGGTSISVLLLAIPLVGGVIADDETPRLTECYVNNFLSLIIYLVKG